MSATDELIENARAYAAAFDLAGAPGRPARRVAVVACMDARLNVYRILGLSEGEAHVIRNAGGVVTDEEIRSLAISQHMLGTDEIMIIHHTDCGMLTFTREEFAQRLHEASGRTPQWTAHSFRDLDQDVRACLQRIKESPFIPNKDSVRGFIYDVETGALHEVTGATEAPDR